MHPRRQASRVVPAAQTFQELSIASTHDTEDVQVEVVRGDHVVDADDRCAALRANILAADPSISGAAQINPTAGRCDHGLDRLTARASPRRDPCETLGMASSDS